jgi:hypothetical protein
MFFVVAESVESIYGIRIVSIALNISMLFKEAGKTVKLSSKKHSQCNDLCDYQGEFVK